MIHNTKNLYQINPKMVDWDLEDSALFFNERHIDRAFFKASIPHLPYLKAHIWLATSGRTQQKWVAISKKALLCSAQAVNQHLKATFKDRWGICLPVFHVGGLAIMARAFLSQSPYFVYEGKWEAQAFYRFLKKKEITLCSLVPTQVYDLVKAQFLAPPHLRALVVGGENLSPSLYQSALALKWPLLPSYGLTECGSQVATAELSSLKASVFPPLKILSHVEVKIKKGEIALKSKSLLTGFWPLLVLKPNTTKNQVQTVKTGKRALEHFIPFEKMTKKGWYLTGDKGQVVQGQVVQKSKNISNMSKSKNISNMSKNLFLQVDKSETIKILGEKVNISNLKDKLTGLLLKHSFAGRAFLLPLPAEREGWQIAVVTNIFDKNALFNTIYEFNQEVSPFEKIKILYFVPTLPLTGISKLNQTALLKQLCF